MKRSTTRSTTRAKTRSTTRSQIPCLIAIFTLGFSGNLLAQAHAAGLEPPVLRLSLESEPTTLDWAQAASASDRFILSFLMRGLMKYDSSAKLVCDLCLSSAASLDGKSIRFELDPKTVWSDGVPLKPQHFIDAFERLLSPAHHFTAAKDFQVVESVKQTGPMEIEFRLSTPFPGFADLLATVASFPIRKELGPGESHVSTAVLGPYQLAAWEHGKKIVIEGNPKFTGTRPVYRVDFWLGPHAVQFKRFKAGKLDILSGPTLEDAMSTPGERIQVSPYWATRALIFNLRRPLPSKLPFRKSVLDSLNRTELPAFLKNGEIQATGLIPAGLAGHRTLALTTQDLSRAASEFAQAVSGRETTAPLKLLTHGNETDLRVAAWLKSELALVHIPIHLNAVSEAKFEASAAQGDFDVALTTLSLRTADPADLLETFQTAASRNWGRWTHVGFDDLLLQISHSSKPEQTSVLIDQATQILEAREVPVIPLSYPTQAFLLGSRVVGFAVTPYGDPDLIKIELKH